MRNSCIILIRKPDWKRSLEDVGVDGGNIIMGLREVGWEAVDWIYLAQDRDQWRILVNTVMNLQVS
jgi:hypothetical protein